MKPSGEASRVFVFGSNLWGIHGAGSAREAFRFHGAVPGVDVVALVPLRSNVGRDFVWATRAPADDAGVARLRVPYATGQNGAVMAGSYAVQTAGKGRVEAPVTEAQVTGGEAVEVALDGRKVERR